MKQKETKSKWKEIAMVFGISIMFAILVFTGIYAFYDEPKYDIFCKQQPYRSMPVKAGVDCQQVQTANDTRCWQDGGMSIYDYDSQGCNIYKSCDYCNKEYNDASAKFRRNVFFIAAPIGLLAIIVGLIWLIDFIGVGFMFGGILTLVWSTGQYFGDMSKEMRFFVILVEFIILLWIAYKKVKR
jgi:hypothetical protein